jgi:glycosyltransferase involved in cell wall biosynthesis
MKKKILFCTESGQVNSGYGNYTKSILSRLYKTNKYDIAELSCYRTVETSKAESEKWKIYPNAVDQKDERFNSYSSNFSNQFGQWRFDLVVADFQPDIVVDFRDVMMALFQRASVFREKFHWILAPTIDSFPVRAEWLDCIKNCDTLLTHTLWAKKEIENRYNLRVDGVVKDSIDTDIFKPQNKITVRQKHNIPLDAFVIGSVMRNQKRKLIPDVLDVFSQISAKHDNAYLYLHTSYPETHGWDIPELLLRYDICNKVFFTYFCKKCKNWQPMVWKGEKSICPKCGNKSMILSQVSHGVEDVDLCQIYNIFDVYLQYAICEGFGIPPLEAASCGIPFINIDHGAMQELAEDLSCASVSVQSLFTEQESSAIRVLPNNKDCVKIIENYLNMPHIDMLDIKTKIRQSVLDKHSWDKTCNIFEEIFDNTEKLSYKRWKPLPGSYFDQINKSVPDLENNREFIYYIIDNIIQEQSLKDSFFIQQMVKALDLGYILNGDNQSQPYGREDAKKVLEVWFNNKKMLNGFLKDRNIIAQKDFLNY